MKKLLCLIFIFSITLINAQGITNTVGTNDANSNFLVTNPSGNPLMQIQGNGWIGFGTNTPVYPFQVIANHYDDANSTYFQPTGLFVNTVQDKDGVGVAGYCDNTTVWGVGVYGRGGYMGVLGEVISDGPENGDSYFGVRGSVEGGSGLNKGVDGSAYDGYRAYGGDFDGSGGSDRSYGARGEAWGSPHNYGLYGRGSVAATGGNAYGVLGHAEGANGQNFGVYGYATGATNNWAGYFFGDVYVTGTFSKAAGSFKIDHPLDPANKYLSHSFVESPDMMNIYNGNIELNFAGEAEIELPEWFESLNNDYRYQLTAIGSPGPNLYVAHEVAGNTFHIAGGEPGMKVSWQLTGIRKDPYANANRIKVEEYKTTNDIGKYLYPEAYGMPQSRHINYEVITQEIEMLYKDKERR